MFVSRVVGWAISFIVPDVSGVGHQLRLCPEWVGGLLAMFVGGWAISCVCGRVGHQ